MITTHTELVTIRDFMPTDEDFAKTNRIDDANFPDYVQTLEESKHWYESLDTSRYARRRYMADLVGTGDTVAWVEWRHSVYSFDPDRYYMWLCVHPDHQRRGIGSHLYARVLADMRARNAQALRAQANEKYLHTVSFLDKRGFYEIAREWESRMNPQHFDPTAFEGYVQRLDEMGIEVVTLAQLRESDPDWLRKLYELQTQAEADVPSPSPYTAPTIEQFERGEISAPALIPEAFFVGRLGDRYVGESYMMRSHETEHALDQGFTGVAREFRGRGIAVALKAIGLMWAKQTGCNALKTWNSTLNEPMLAVNGKLGYQRLPAWIDYEKRLRPDASDDRGAEDTA